MIHSNSNLESDQILVGVLSNLQAPLLPLLIRSLREEGINNICVIADKKVLSEKDQRIWIERTRGAFDSDGYSLYDFGLWRIPFYLVQSHNGDDCIQLLDRLRPEILINGGTPRKLEKPILEIPPLGVINVHPGLLPKYRGSCCVEWAILNDDPVGLTAHFMVEGYDEGPVIDTELCCFTLDDDYVSIREQVYRRSISMMARITRKVLKEKITGNDCIPQGNGFFFSPITKVQLQEVIDKIQTHAYKHMK